LTTFEIACGLVSCLDAQMGSISLIQLPYDSGRFGERMGRGPIALIDSGLAEHLRSLGNEVDVASVRLPEELHSEANALVELQRLAVALIRDAIERQARPIILSGNCGSAALSAVAALNPREIAIIWFDAHADFNTPETSQSGFLDGMGLAILTGRCWRGLAERFDSFRPLPDTHVTQVGVREIDPTEMQLLNQSGIKQLPTSRLTELSELLKQLSTNTVYVHVDLDVIDSSEGRANGWACDGGLSVNQLYDALELIGRSASIVASAVTCYDPAVDTNGRIGRAIPRIVELLAR
jgi:arginase